MQVNEYQKEAMATLDPALDKKDVLINGVMGLCGESGEAIDIVKKWLMQGHELDKEHLVRELGDVAWYLAEAATALDVPLEAVFQGNLDKLRQRSGFSENRRKAGYDRLLPCAGLWLQGVCQPCDAPPRSKGNCGEGRHSLRKADFDRKVGALLFTRQRKGAGNYRERALSATAV